MPEIQMSPEDYLNLVRDEKTFLTFLQILSEDWEKASTIEKQAPSPPYGTSALGWENGTIGAFLEAAAACGMDHMPRGGLEPNANPWKKAASIIYSGKIYE